MWGLTSMPGWAAAGRVYGIDEGVADDLAWVAPRTPAVSKFEVADRVRLLGPIASNGRGPFGTVTGFITPTLAAKLGAPDDVRVRWDSGLELAHPPATLTHARDAAHEHARRSAKGSEPTR